MVCASAPMFDCMESWDYISDGLFFCKVADLTVV